MKTTIDLPDALADQARELARAQGVTLRELVVEGLRSELERRATPPPRVDFVFATVRGDGRSPELAPQDAMARSYGLPS
jgi:hypothetical protein